MLFRTVLSNLTVLRYVKYVDSLSKDLSDAMGIAQETAAKQQHRQAGIYNRNVKGADIITGDQVVLLANKTKVAKGKLLIDGSQRFILLLT